MIALGNLLADQFNQLSEADAVYREAMHDSTSELVAKANLGWLLVKSGKIEEAKALRSELAELDTEGLALFDAALKIADDNFGSATEHLIAALNASSSSLLTTYLALTLPPSSPRESARLRREIDRMA